MSDLEHEHEEFDDGINPPNLEPDTKRHLHYDTNFGDIYLREDRLLSFPKGLLGLPGCTVFGLSRLPNVDESPLLLLHCVNDPQITFLVADPQVLGVPLKPEDMRQAIKDTGLTPKDTQFLVILTLYSDDEAGYLTANLRAPLLIDSRNRTGVQHILPNKEYTTQHKI